MKLNVPNLKVSLIGACLLAAIAAPNALADNFFGSFLGSLTGGVGGGATKSSDNAPNKNDSTEGMQERRYSYLETAEGAGARLSTQPSYGYGGSDIRDAKGSAQPGMIMGAQLNGTLYSEVPMTPLATITFPVASKAQENEMYKHCPPLTGYHLTDSADYINTAIANDVLLGKLSDPERWVNVAKVTQQAQNTQTGNMMAEMARNQANSAIDFCSTYMTNFTTSEKWNDVRNKLFIPIAILLLLPGAMLAQVKAIVAAGNPVLEETHPFDGLLRSIVAIFLIPATCLVLNYGIDLSNSLTYTIKTEYQNIFHDDMYQSAICAQVRAFPVRQEAENRGALDLPTTKMGQLLPEQKTVFARVEGQLFSTKLEDPCAGLYIAPKERADEALPTKVVAARLAFNSMNAVLCAGWNALCAFQTIYLYYLWLMGPIVAALWVWPMKFLRDALPSWIEGCVTLCFWSLLWNTTILLMACFRGYDETGTFVMTALNTLATICVKYSFDFVQMVMAAGSQASAVGEKLGEAMKANSGGGHGSASRSGGGGHHNHGGGGAGPTSRPSTAMNSAHVLGGAGGHGAGIGGGAGGVGSGGLSGALAGGHGGGGVDGVGGGGELSAPLSLMAGHAGGSSSGVGGGLGAISHGGIPGSHGGTLPMLGNLSHGAPPIAGAHGAGGLGGHAMPPNAAFDLTSHHLNSNTHGMGMHGVSSHMGDVTNLSNALHMAGGDHGGMGGGLGSVFNGGDVTHMAGGGLGPVFNGGDINNMASTLGAASMLGGMSSTFNGGDVMNSANVMNAANVTNGGDEVAAAASFDSFLDGMDIDSTLNTAFDAGNDISNISSSFNFGNGTTLNGGDINLPPMSGADVDNNIAQLLGDDVSNVANMAGSMVDGGDINNMSSNLNAAISGDVNVSGANFNATMNGGDVNNSSSSNSVGGSVHSNVASFVNNGGDVSSSVSNASNMTSSFAASMINNLDVSNSMNAANNMSNMVDQGVDINSNMSSSMDMTNVSTTSANMSTDASSSMVSNVDVNSVGPSSMSSSSSSTTYDVDHNASHNVDASYSASNSSSATYASSNSYDGGTQYVSNGGTQYTSGGGTQYTSGGGTQYTSNSGGGGVQYSESRANAAAGVGASMQNQIANELGGGTPQGQASAMQQMYQMGDNGTGASNSTSISSTSAASFDTSSMNSYSSSSSTSSMSSASFDSSSSYAPSTSYASSTTAYDSSSSASAGGASYASAPSYSGSDSSSGASSNGSSNVVQALAPTQQGGTQQTSYGDGGSSSSSSSSSSYSLNFDSSSSSAAAAANAAASAVQQQSADATSIATPAASNYTYAADTSVASGGSHSGSTASGSSSTTYFVDNASTASGGGGAAAEYARYAMSDHGTISHASAGAPPVNSGETVAPPMIVVPVQSFNRQAASLHDAVKEGMSKQEKSEAPKPESNAKEAAGGKPVSKLGNALRGAGCPLPPGDKSAMPPSTKKPAQTNTQFAAGAAESAPPPASRTDAMDIAAGNTRNRYRQTRKMTEEEIREMEESAGSWLV